MLLAHEVVTHDGELLLPSGSRFDRQTLGELIRRRKKPQRRAVPFANLGGPIRDLREFLGKAPYRTIFSQPRETAEILSLMGQVALLEPVIESLEYFREKDFHTYRHCLMVFALSTLLAKHLYHDDDRSLLGALAGPSHDLGKVCVPVSILQKRTPLTRMELGCLKHHTLAGYVLMSYYTGDFRHLTAMVARDHHERQDGSGYPRGVDSFGEMVEVVILSDIYDALISPRPYRPVSYDNRSALEELTRMATKGQIGWRALKALVAFNRSNRPDIRTCEVSLERRGLPPANNVYGQIAEENPSTPGD